MTTQEVLAMLKDHLRNDPDAANTWDVLTALRGPDEENESVKNATTEVIRHKLLGDVGILTGEFQSQRSWTGFHLCPDSPNSAKLRSTIDYYGHFSGHVERAFKVLGLKWSEVNS